MLKNPILNGLFDVLVSILQELFTEKNSIHTYKRNVRTSQKYVYVCMYVCMYVVCTVSMYVPFFLALASSRVDENPSWNTRKSGFSLRLSAMALITSGSAKIESAFSGSICRTARG